MAALEFAKTCMEAEEWVPKTGRIVELKQAIAQIFNQKEVGLLPAALANKTYRSMEFLDVVVAELLFSMVDGQNKGNLQNVPRASLCAGLGAFSEDGKVSEGDEEQTKYLAPPGCSWLLLAAPGSS